MPETADPYLHLGFAFIRKATAALQLPYWHDGMPEQQPGEYQKIDAATKPGATREEAQQVAGDTLHLMANEMLLGKQPWSEVVSTYCKAWLYGKHPWAMLSLGQVLANNSYPDYALEAYRVVELYPQHLSASPQRLDEAGLKSMLDSLQRSIEALPSRKLG
jgi:hypothetical protein